jgi:hypothetical protein
MSGMNDAPAECRLCGTAIRDTDAVEQVGGSLVHATCAPSDSAQHSRKEPRRTGSDAGTRIGVARSVNSWR